MIRRLPFAVVLVAILASPQLLVGQSADENEQDHTAVKTHVVVENDNMLDMRIYAVSAGRRHQLGTVTGFTSAVFVLPSWLLAQNAPIQLIALPIGTRKDVVSPFVLVDPGDLVEWQLRGNLGFSNISVWKS